MYPPKQVELYAISESGYRRFIEASAEYIQITE